MTQNDRVLQYLNEQGSITPLDAYQELGIMRLASRISDLKRRGYPISKTMKVSKNRRGEKVHFAEYRLSENE